MNCEISKSNPRFCPPASKWLLYACDQRSIRSPDTLPSRESEELQGLKESHKGGDIDWPDKGGSLETTRGDLYSTSYHLRS